MTSTRKTPRPPAPRRATFAAGLAATAITGGAALATPAPMAAPAATPDAAAAPQADAAAHAVRRTWRFDVRLDGRPIGHHRFTVVREGDRRTVTSEADFDVRLLGFSVYRYTFRASEQWTGDCLRTLDADTDDDGKALHVRAAPATDGLRIENGQGVQDVPGCLMTYAYWNPAALRAQTRLLDPQTGRVDPVTVSPAPPGTLEVDGRPVAARRFRVQAPKGPVDVWTTADGRWVGLDARVGGGRHLTYRLAAAPATSAAATPAAPSPAPTGPDPR